MSPDGKLLATGSYDGVVVWDLQTLTAKRAFTTLRLSYNSITARGGGLSFLPDSKSLLVSTRPPDDGPIRVDSKLELAQVWNVETGKKTFALTGQYDYYATAWPAAGGKELVLCSNTLNGTSAFRSFDAKDGKELRSVPSPVVGNPPWVGPGGNLVVTQGQGQPNGGVVDVRDGKEVLGLSEPPAQVALSRDEKLLVWVDKAGTVHVHDLAAKKEKFTFEHPEKTKPGPDGRLGRQQDALFPSSHGRLFRWDLETNKKGPDFGNRHNFWSLTAWR